MKNSPITHIFKYIITGLAILNLILLFVFHYEMPEVIKNKFFQDSKMEDLYINKNTSQNNLDIHLETETLSYAGTAPLDLLSGVTVTDEEGNLLDDLTIYADIKNTEEQTKKIIIYSVRDEAGKEATKERNLLLNDYYGPTLTVSNTYPEIYDTDLGSLLDIFQSNELLSANDGYGQNISQAIECSYDISNIRATTVDITFKVTNHFKDSISQTITVPLNRTLPLIVLTETSVTLKVGETFSPLSYVESATNEEGTNLTSLITMEGDVNTGVAGEYSLTYNLTDRDGEVAPSVTLRVVVEE